MIVVRSVWICKDCCEQFTVRRVAIFCPGCMLETQPLGSKCETRHREKRFVIISDSLSLYILFSSQESISITVDGRHRARD